MCYFNRSSSEQNCFDQMRQHNCGTYQHTTGGGRISTSLFSDVVYLELSNRWQCLSESSSYCRVKKYSSRSLEPSPDSTNRMDLNISILQNFFSDFWTSPHRHVCIQLQSWNTDLLHMVSTPSSICTKCSVSLLGGNVFVCLSSHLSHPKSLTWDDLTVQ